MADSLVVFLGAGQHRVADSLAVFLGAGQLQVADSLAVFLAAALLWWSAAALAAESVDLQDPAAVA